MIIYLTKVALKIKGKVKQSRELSSRRGVIKNGKQLKSDISSCVHLKERFPLMGRKANDFNIVLVI